MTMTESAASISVLKVREDHAEATQDTVAIEKRVAVSVNGQNVLNLFCTPSMIREFVVGIIYNEGLITGEWCADRISIEYGEEIRVDIPAAGSVTRGEVTITSGCAGGVSLYRREPHQRISDTTRFRLDDLREVFREFQKRSELYRETGGAHSAAISDGKTILAFSEDIGRHNAVDKVIGFGILEQIPFGGKVMLASGRLSSEIVSKCARCGIPVLVSRAAPTSLAVEIALSAGMTMVGFMRGDRMNIYAGRERVLL